LEHLTDTATNLNIFVIAHHNTLGGGERERKKERGREKSGGDRGREREGGREKGWGREREEERRREKGGGGRQRKREGERGRENTIGKSQIYNIMYNIDTFTVCTCT
jgi:hypothetical protein